MLWQGAPPYLIAIDDTSGDWTEGIGRSTGRFSTSGVLLHGQDNNCLISTFCQLLQKPLEHAVVWDALRRKCPEHVDAQNFLEVNAVWRDLLQALGEDPTLFHIICVNNLFSRRGVVLGNGPTRLRLLNEGNAHFVPLWPRD